MYLIIEDSSFEMGRGWKGFTFIFEEGPLDAGAVEVVSELGGQRLNVDDGSIDTVDDFFAI